MGYYLMYFAVSFLITWILVAPCRAAALRYEITRQETARPRSANENRPLLGGAAVYFGFLFTLLAFFFWQMADAEIGIVIAQHKLLAILLGTLIVSLSGLLHDVYSLPAMVRASIYLLAAMLLVAGDMRCYFPFFDVGAFIWRDTAFSIGNTIVAVAWVVLLTASCNLLERLDGMVTGIVTIAGIFFFIVALLVRDYTNALFCILMVGTALGILWQQMPPASLLLGSMGSGFFGFMLAVIGLQTMSSLPPFLSSHYGKSLSYALALVVPLSLVVVPVIMSIAMAIRRMAGKPHTLQALIDHARSHTTNMSYLLTMAFAVTAGMGLLSLVVCVVASTTLTLVLLALAGLMVFVLTIQLL